METVTTLVEYEVKSGTGKRGPWKFYLFKDNTGTSYQTGFDSDALGSEVTNYLNQPARISYEIVTRGDFQNNVIQAIQSANGSSPSIPLADVPAPLPANSKKDVDWDLIGLQKTRCALAAALAPAAFAALEPEEQDLDAVLVIAERLVAYIYEGEPAETVAA